MLIQVHNPPRTSCCQEVQTHTRRHSSWGNQFEGGEVIYKSLCFSAWTMVTDWQETSTAHLTKSVREVVTEYFSGSEMAIFVHEIHRDDIYFTVPGIKTQPCAPLTVRCTQQIKLRLCRNLRINSAVFRLWVFWKNRGCELRNSGAGLFIPTCYREAFVWLFG